MEVQNIVSAATYDLRFSGGEDVRNTADKGARAKESDGCYLFKLWAAEDSKVFVNDVVTTSNLNRLRLRFRETFAHKPSLLYNFNRFEA